MSQPAASPAAKVTPRHYQAVCALSLSGLMLLQLQQSTLAAHISLLVGVLIGFIGVRALYYRSRMSPMLVLIAIALPNIFEQYYANQNSNPDMQPHRFLDLADVLICVTALTYFIGHYRLNGLWYGVVPVSTSAVRRDQGRLPGSRSEESLSAAELVALVFTIPAFALLAQFAFLLLAQRWTLLELGPRPRQFLAVAWILFVVMFLAAHAFRYWQRLQMDRISAMLMLQDILWNETRGEQRRIQRWLAWVRLGSRK